MSDFAKQFTMDYDASDAGFGVVLYQADGPLAFFSQPFAARHLKLAAYERELIRLIQAIHHWRLYLWGVTFWSTRIITASSSYWTNASPPCRSTNDQ